MLNVLLAMNLSATTNPYACVCVNILVYVFIRPYLLVLETLFHYHCPYICELVLEVSILLKIFFVYEWPILCTPNHSLYLSQYVWPCFCHLHCMFD